MQKRTWMTTIGAVCLLLLGVASASQSVAPQSVIPMRQQAFKEMGASLKTARDELRRSGTELSGVRLAAASIRRTADAMAAWFPSGTGPQAGVKTSARTEVWSNAAVFEQKREALVVQADAFIVAVEGEDKATISAALRSLNRTCKSCHDLFYEEET